MTKTPENKTLGKHCEVSFVYCLLEPDTPEEIIRYVGQSKNVKDRYRQHVSRASKENNKKAKWIQGLKKQNKKPILKLVECVSLDLINEREAFYIGKFDSEHLLNGDEGYYSVSKNTRINKPEVIGVKFKHGLWEVYLNLDNERYFCGAFTSKLVAQKVYDSVARKYKTEPYYTNFEGVSKLTVEQAQELSKRLTRKRNNLTKYEGIYKITDSDRIKVKIKISQKWVQLGYTKDLYLALQVRDAVANHYNIKTFKYHNEKPLTIKQAQDKLNTKTVKYRGVSFRKTDNKYCATITLNSKNYTLPLFTKVEEAVKWYDRVAGYYNKPTNFKPDFTISIEEARIKIKQERKNKPNL
jgi:hypothetical protein